MCYMEVVFNVKFWFEKEIGIVIVKLVFVYDGDMVV